MTDLPPGPMPDPDAFERLRRLHDADLAYYDERDPASPCYGRPDLAERRRLEAEAAFASILIRHGVRAPEPATAEQIASERLDSGWQGGLGDRQRDLLDQEIAADTDLTPAMRELRAAELEGMLGEPEYKRLLDQALAAMKPGETLPQAAKSNAYVLQNLAAIGKYRQAHARARAAAFG